MAPTAVLTPAHAMHALPGYDFSDAFAIEVQNCALDAPSAAREAIAAQPGWIGHLLALRNVLVKPFGLKTGADANLPPSRRIGIFPVVSATPDRIVLGFDDAHLDFRIVVDVQPVGETARRVTATTLVRRKNLFGRVYLASVMPFHKLIVPTLLARLQPQP